MKNAWRPLKKFVGEFFNNLNIISGKTALQCQQSQGVCYNGFNFLLLDTENTFST